MDPATASVTVDDTLAALPADQRAALQTLRATIAAAAPEAEDTISYGMPAFRYHGRSLVAYAAFKAHCSLFPMGSLAAIADPAELAGFATSKGTLRFTPQHPLPSELVERIVHGRMAQIDARPTGRRRPKTT